MRNASWRRPRPVSRIERSSRRLRRRWWKVPGQARPSSPRRWPGSSSVSAADGSARSCLKARPKRRANSPRFDVRAALYYVVGLDLTEIEGVSELTALTVVSEIGPGVSRFATAKKFCSWLGLCPNWKKTGGRVRSSRTRRGVNRAARALRVAAQGLHHSKGALGGFLRRMKGRLGAQAALTATAHKLARIVYLALKHGMTYVRQGQEEYEARMKEKQVKALRRKARQLGLEVVEKTAGSVPVATAAQG